MIYFQGSKTTRGVAAHDFLVQIDPFSGPSKETPALVMGIDRYSGLSNASINMIKHRGNGLANTAKTNYAGLRESGVVTFEGVWLADMNDVKALQFWYDQVARQRPSHQF